MAFKPKRTEDEYLAMVALVPIHVQPALARMLWWDHVDALLTREIADERAYANGMPRLKAVGRHFEIGREDVDLTVDEVLAALLSCGYSERMAVKRARSFVRMQEEYKGVVPDRDTVQ